MDGASGRTKLFTCGNMARDLWPPTSGERPAIAISVIRPTARRLRRPSELPFQDARPSREFPFRPPFRRSAEFRRRVLNWMPDTNVEVRTISPGIAQSGRAAGRCRHAFATRPATVTRSGGPGHGCRLRRARVRAEHEVGIDLTGQVLPGGPSRGYRTRKPFSETCAQCHCPADQERSRAQSGHNPKISTVWSTSTKPASAATRCAQRSTARPSTSTLRPQERQVTW